MWRRHANGGSSSRSAVSQGRGLRWRGYHACVAMLATRSRFRSLALATAVATIVLFAVGGLVRGTGSGLGCSTWPACEPGRLFPSGTVHSLIEFSHRALAFLVIVLTRATGVAAWRALDRDPASCSGPRSLAFPLVLAQAGLGGIVVATELDPVVGHGALRRGPGADRRRDVRRGRRPASDAASATRRRSIPRPARRSPPRPRRPAPAGGPTFGPATPQLVFTDWPLMDGRLVPTLGGAATAMFTHRVLAVAGFCSCCGRDPRATRWRGAPASWSASRPWRSCCSSPRSRRRGQRVLAAAARGRSSRTSRCPSLIWATLVALAAVPARGAAPAAPRGTDVDAAGETRRGPSCAGHRTPTSG